MASAQETPAALCLASPGKRTRRKRRVRPVGTQRAVPWRPMTGVPGSQVIPQTYPGGSDQALQRGFLSELRVLNIYDSYLSKNWPKVD